MLRCLIFCLALIWSTSGVLAAAAPGERKAFEIAASAFQGQFWERADREFGEFIQTFPESERIPEAILFQAQSRFRLGRYDAVIALLSERPESVRTPSDQYLYWLAQAHYQSGNYAAAAAAFSKLANDFPESLLRFEASVNEAASWARLGEWSRVVELLKASGGAFQRTVQDRSGDELVARGYLLLGEAQFELGDYTGAQATLDAVPAQQFRTELEWKRLYLQCRLQAAGPRLEDASQSASNLLVLAQTANDPRLLGESRVFQADLFERMGQLDKAAAMYQGNLSTNIPTSHQRHALLRITDLYLKADRLTNAVEVLQQYLDQPPTAGAVDMALLTLGELRLIQHTTATNRVDLPSGTNLVQLALARFETLLSGYPGSALAGKAFLNKGWCLWLGNQFAESEEAFRQAAARLPVSRDQAVARFKQADALFMQGNFAQAVDEYRGLIEAYEASEEIRDGLLERALYQTVRAALSASDLPAATDAMQKILEWYPNGMKGDRCLLLVGQGYAQERDTARAQQLFADFEVRYPTNALLPKVRLAIARTYEQQGDWMAAVTNYDAWVSNFSDHPNLPDAEFCRARANFKSGRETNGVALFTSFIARFPGHELAQWAHWSLGDYYFARFAEGAQGEGQKAEESYQRVFRSTNWPPSRLTFEAQLMAGRVAVARLSYEQAIQYYFTNLATNPRCPLDLRIQAAFAAGDAFVMGGPAKTNRQADLQEAIGWFTMIPSTNAQAPMARVRIGDCYKEMGVFDETYYDRAVEAYQTAAVWTNASVAVRSEAKIGLGNVYRKRAELRTGAEQAAWRERARDEYWDVFVRSNVNSGEQPDLFWVKEAGLQTAAESGALRQWDKAIGVYEEMKRLLPQLSAELDERIRTAQRRQAAERL